MKNDPINHLDVEGFIYSEYTDYVYQQGKAEWDNMMSLGGAKAAYQKWLNNLMSSTNNFWRNVMQPSIKNSIYQGYYKEYSAGQCVNRINDAISNGEVQLDPDMKLYSTLMSFIDSLGKPISLENFYKNMNKIPRKKNK